MGPYFLRFIRLSYQFSKYLWLTYTFVFFLRKLKVLFLSFYHYLFCSSSLLTFLFFFERLIDFFYVFVYNFKLTEGLLNRLFVFKFFIIRFFFLVFRFLFARFFMYCFLIFSRDFSFLRRKKTQKKSEGVSALFSLFFFRIHTRKPYYDIKTETNDFLIYHHSKTLTCLFFAMFITVIFFFNIRMSSIFPYGVCNPRNFNWFKYQKSQGVTKYIVTFWKNIWRKPIRFHNEFKIILWESFVDFVFFAIKPLVALELWFKKFTR